MNKFGVMSLLMFSSSIIAFYILKGPDADVYLGIKIFSVLSIIGIVFAFMSRNKVWILIGGILNFCILVMSFFLLLAMGIGEP